MFEGETRKLRGETRKAMNTPVKQSDEMRTLAYELGQIKQRQKDKGNIEWLNQESVTLMAAADALQDAANTIEDLREQLEDNSRGECENIGYYLDPTRFECSSCGYNGWTKWAEDGEDRIPNYCPSCGEKVVKQ